MNENAVCDAIDRGDWNALEESGKFSRSWLDHMRSRDARVDEPRFVVTLALVGFVAELRPA